MKEVEAAANEFGADIHGQGEAHEPLGESDAHLKHAQQLLQSLSSSKSSKHIQRALKELATALSIK